MDRYIYCPKHVESYSKNTFEELVSPVDFITTVYHDARSPEHQMYTHVTYIHKHTYITSIQVHSYIRGGKAIFVNL